MNYDLLYSVSNLKLEYSPKGNFILETWSGVTPSAIYATLVDVLIGFLLRKNADAILIDPVNHKGFGPNSQILRAERVKDYVDAHGSLKQAIVTPIDIFSKFSIESYASHFKNNPAISTSFFQTLDDAVNWIQQFDTRKDSVYSNRVGGMNNLGI